TRIERSVGPQPGIALVGDRCEAHLALDGGRILARMRQLEQVLSIDDVDDRGLAPDHPPGDFRDRIERAVARYVENGLPPDGFQLEESVDPIGPGLRHGAATPRCSSPKRGLGAIRMVSNLLTRLSIVPRGDAPRRHYSE